MLIVVFDNLVEVGTLMDTMFIYYSLIDAHACLAAPYNACDVYPGYCLTMSIIQVPLSLCPTVAVPNTRNALIKVTHVIKEQYLWQKAYPLLLPIDGQQAELMLTGICVTMLQAAQSYPAPAS